MSKSLEQAYKELAQEEVPDLWNRIEAGLKDRTEVTSQSAPVQKKNILVVLKKYSGVAAAALCVVILVPAILFIDRAGLGDKGMATEESAVCEDTAPAEAAPAEEEAVDMAAEAEEFETVTEETAAVTEEAEMLEDTTEEAAATKECESTKEAAAEMEKDGASMEMQPTEDSILNAAGQKKQETVKLQDGCLFSQIQVMVTEEREGAVYYVLVEKDDSGTFAEGEKIRIFRPADASFLMNEGESITLELRYSAKDNYFVAEQVSDDN